MAKIHGRNATIYIGATNGAAASPVTGRTSLTIDMTADRVDVTAMGDTAKTYVQGLADGSISFNGFYDEGAFNAIAAALDGLARTYYVYPNSSDTAKYFFGTGFIDVNMEVGVNDAVKVNGSIKPATPITKSSGLT